MPTFPPFDLAKARPSFPQGEEGPSPIGVAPFLLPAILLAHALLWIVLPLLLEGSIRLDVSEGAIGGREWQLAYLRHPPFTTWLVELARETGPLRYAAVYAIGQVLSLGGLVLIVAVAGQLEDEPRAAPRLTLLLGLASPALTYIPIQVSHNIGLTFASGLVILTAWRAFEGGRLGDWLAFGVAVGFGLWVKYAIGLLVLPLMLAFLAVRSWRRQLAAPGPWLAVLVAFAVIAPHAWFVWRHGATTVSFATRTVSPGFVANLRYALEFLLDALFFMAPMALVAGLAAGFSAMSQRIVTSFSRAGMTRQDLFRHAIAFGPALVVVAAAVITGVKPRLLWLTPMIPPFALWWAHMALPVLHPRAVVSTLAAIAALLAVSYVGVRLISPIYGAKPLYPDFDGPALARLAQAHWQRNEGGPLRYIVSFGQQKGRQAAGSVAFDLPSPSENPIHLMEDGSLVASPWIDVADLKARGALIVSTVPIGSEATVQGLPIGHAEERQRPMVRGAARADARIWLGIVAPAR